MTPVKVIIISEGVWQSLARDLGTFVMIIALIGVGVILESSAMQWVGAIMAFITMLAKSARHTRYTIDEARKRLDELEAA